MNFKGAVVIFFTFFGVALAQGGFQEQQEKLNNIISGVENFLSSPMSSLTPDNVRATKMDLDGRFEDGINYFTEGDGTPLAAPAAASIRALEAAVDQYAFALLDSVEGGNSGGGPSTDLQTATQNVNQALAAVKQVSGQYKMFSVGK